MADAILSGEAASDSSFVPVYILLGLMTAAAPVVGIQGLTAVTRRGQVWLARFSFGVALVLPAIYTIGLAFVLLRGGIFPAPD